MRADPPIVSWPGGEASRDPWDDRCWPSLDTERRFTAVWTAWDAYRKGTTSECAFREVCEQHDLTDPLVPDQCTPSWGHPAPSLEDLARIALDYWPAAGMDAPDICLGPESLFASRALRLAAVASAAFLRTEDWGHSAYTIWYRSKPRPTVAHRAKIHAVQMAPWALWRLHPRADGRFDAEDLTGLVRFVQPDGPITPVVPLEGGVVVARILHADTGWIAHTPVPIPYEPAQEDIQRWITLETWLARTFQPGITTESLLRRRPVLVRRALEGYGGPR